MAGSVRVVRIEGLAELRAKLTPELYREAGKAALKQISESAAGAARTGAPHKTNKLRGSIRPKVNAGAKPAWAAVKVGALNPSGYSYPKLLEFSPKHGHQNWLQKAVNRARGSFEAAVGRAASMVERKWSG